MVDHETLVHYQFLTFLVVIGALALYLSLDRLSTLLAHGVCVFLECGGYLSESLLS